MFGRQSRARMSAVEGKVRSVRTFNSNASHQQATDKMTKNTTDSTRNYTKSYKSSMRPKSNHARMSGVEGRVRSVKMLNDSASHQQVTDKTTKNTTDSTRNYTKGCKSDMQTKSCSSARATKMTTTNTKK